MSKRPVNRIRRSVFTFVTVAVCIVLSFSLAKDGHDTRVAQTVADGLISLAMWLAIAYVGASSIDYSLGGGMPAFLSRRRGREWSGPPPQMEEYETREYETRPPRDLGDRRRPNPGD